MQRHSMTHRTVPLFVPRESNTNGRRATARYNEGTAAEPTPEQMRDDGRADGIPLVTLERLEAERQRYIDNITRIVTT